MIEPELVREIDEAMSGLQLNDDMTLLYTLEAIHELSHVLGGLFHAEVNIALAHVDTMADDNPGDLREYVAQFIAEQRMRFEHWLREEAGLPYVNWWCQHSSGVIFRWSIEAAGK